MSSLPENKKQVVPIFTVGYGLRAPDEFITLLHQYKIQFLVDVRTSPFSKNNPSFSEGKIKEWLLTKKVRYLFLGDLLGGRPADASCYTEGRVDYNKYSQRDSYKKGITRLRNAFRQQLYVALMCSESKPQMCHRSKLIGSSLDELSIPVFHIDEKGDLKSQEQVIQLVIDDQQQLFDSVYKDPVSYSRKKYSNGNSDIEPEQPRDTDDWGLRVQRG
jgi:uncharacterized protein (DUF488 family)